MKFRVCLCYIKRCWLCIAHFCPRCKQVTVAIYVLYKSWPSGYIISAAESVVALFLFFYGIFKCIRKPWDLKKVSINSLVDSSGSKETGQINSLHVYVRSAVYYFRGGSDERINSNYMKFWNPFDAFVDLAPSYSKRLWSLKLLVRNQDAAHRLAQSALSVTFDRLYTKESLKMMDRWYCFSKVISMSVPMTCAIIQMLLFVLTVIFHHTTGTQEFAECQIHSAKNTRQRFPRQSLLCRVS